MDLTQLANLGEFIGGVAVLVTLIYLSTQIKQSNRLTRAQVLQESARTSTELLARLSPDDLGLMTKAFADPNAVTDQERRFVTSRFIAFVNYHETLFYAWERGEVDEDHWESRKARMLTFIGPARESFWKPSKVLFGRRFGEFLDGHLLTDSRAPSTFFTETQSS